MTHPKVSVIISTYNCARYIVTTVESVLNQTFRDYELIVVDDGSTDDTGLLLQGYRDRLTYIYQENKKYSAARNTGIRAASGKYVAFLDSDDTWYPEKLERQVNVMEQHPEAALIHSQVAYMSANGDPIRFQGRWIKGEAGSEIVIADQRRALFQGTLATTSSVMVRNSALKEAGLFDETHIHGEDWELWVRLASKGSFAYIPEPLARYRVYGWQKILAVEASEAWIGDQLRTIDRATGLWEGPLEALESSRVSGLATIYIRAALASFQMGGGMDGQGKLERALAADPGLACRERLVQLAVDRAKMIQVETGSNKEAKSFIHTFFSHLPPCVAGYKSAWKEATSWLHLGEAFEYHRRCEKALVRRSLMQGLAQYPLNLKNKGVVSIALDAWLGDVVASRLRRALGGSRHKYNPRNKVIT